MSGLVINLIPDSSVIATWGVDWRSTPFGTALTTAADLFQSAISNQITINIDVGWGEVNGSPFGRNALGESEASFNFLNYDSVRTALQADTASPAHAAFANLPASDPISGDHQYVINSGELKALGLLTGNASGADGAIGFGSNANFDYCTNDRAAPNEYDFIGVAEHEISEVMGRVASLGSLNAGAYSILDLFRYSSSGVHQQVGGQPAYFSLDDGSTNLDNFNTISGGDYGDWAASAGNDSFLAFSNPGVENVFSETDVQVMDALGYDMQDTITVEPNATVATPVGFAMMVNVVDGGSNVITSLGADTVNTGSGSDLVFAAGPSILVNAGSGSLTVVGGSGSDTIFAGASPNAQALVYGGPGKMMFVNDTGASTVIGGTGAATIFGGSSASTAIFGGSGQDLIVGEAASMFVEAGSGPATVFGGTGPDEYGFTKGGGGSEVIVGFRPGTDLIQLTAYGPRQAARALHTAVKASGSTTITLSDNTRVTFVGVGHLHASSFV